MSLLAVRLSLGLLLVVGAGSSSQMPSDKPPSTGDSTTTTSTTTTTTTTQATPTTQTSKVTTNSTTPSPAEASTQAAPVLPSVAPLVALSDISAVDSIIAEVFANKANVSLNESPRSEQQQVLASFKKFFFSPRSHDDQNYKQQVREGIFETLEGYGFKPAFLQKSRFEFRRKPAASYNIIGVWPGRQRKTERDRIILVGAHWDSYSQAPGVDDNGSGSTCLLEIARLLSTNRCKFEHTIMLVWFDYEEQGKYGSEFFVNDYLYPLELNQYNSTFLGAYIMDMILVSDPENNTQTLPISLKSKLKDLSDELERERNRGDFLAAWSRQKWDAPLEDTFRESWTSLGNEQRTFKAMRPELPRSGIPSAEERHTWKDFFRSDHASFWYPQLISNTVRRAPSHTQNFATAAATPNAGLYAILLTDLGPWRKSYSRCYHSACDDEHLLTETNLNFMGQVIDSLVLSLMRIARGQCELANGAPAAKATLPSQLQQVNNTISAAASTQHR